MDIHEMQIGQKCYDGEKEYEILQVEKYILLCKNLMTGRTTVIPISYAKKNLKIPVEGEIQIENVHCNGKVENYNFDEFIKLINDGDVYVSEGVLSEMFQQLLGREPMSLADIKFQISTLLIQR